MPRPRRGRRGSVWCGCSVGAATMRRRRRIASPTAMTALHDDPLSSIPPRSPFLPLLRHPPLPAGRSVARGVPRRVVLLCCEDPPLRCGMRWSHRARAPRTGDRSAGHRSATTACGAGGGDPCGRRARCSRMLLDRHRKCRRGHDRSRTASGFLLRTAGCADLRADPDARGPGAMDGPLTVLRARRGHAWMAGRRGTMLRCSGPCPRTVPLCSAMRCSRRRRPASLAHAGDRPQ